MAKVAHDFRTHQTPVIYGTVRLIERDDETELAWAREPWACIVFNLHVDHTPERIACAADAFRRLIDRALAYGGSYYLTYHRWATREQVQAAYPQFIAFLREKLRCDRKSASSRTGTGTTGRCSATTSTFPEIRDARVERWRTWRTWQRWQTFQGLGRVPSSPAKAIWPSPQRFPSPSTLDANPHPYPPPAPRVPGPSGSGERGRIVDTWVGQPAFANA